MRGRTRVGALWLVGLATTAIAAPWVEPRALKLGLFTATLGLEAVGVAAALAVRARLGASDEARRPWSWIAAGLGARALAEVRLGTLYFDAVPGWIHERPELDWLYVQVLRYLYTLGDLLIAGALWLTLRALASLGLGLRLGVGGRLAIAGLAALPLIQFVLQRIAWAGLTPEDPGILPFRVISVLTSALVGGLSLALVGLTRQMGGGALAWVWGAAAAAGIAKALGFVVGAALRGNAWGGVLDQALLWTFAAAWVGAAVIYYEVIGGGGAAMARGRRDG